MQNKLSRKLSEDSCFLGHGVSDHKYALSPPLSEDDVSLIEKENGINLPKEYREFVINIGDGGAGPSYGLYSLHVALTDHGSMHLDGSIKEDFLQPEKLHDDKSNESGLLVICEHGCAHADYLVVNGSARGQIWQYVDGGGFLPAPRKRVRIDYSNCTTIQDRTAKNREHYETLLKLEENDIHTFNTWYEAWLDQPVQFPVKPKKWYQFWR